MDIKLKTSPTTEAILLEKKGQWNAVNNKTTGPCKNRQIQHSWTYQRHHAFKQTNHPFKIGKLSFVVVVKRNVIPNIIICSPVESITHAVLFLEGLGGVCVCVCVCPCFITRPQCSSSATSADRTIHFWPVLFEVRQTPESIGLYCKQHTQQTTPEQTQNLNGLSMHCRVRQSPKNSLQKLKPLYSASSTALQASAHRLTRQESN